MPASTGKTNTAGVIATPFDLVDGTEVVGAPVTDSVDELVDAADAVATVGTVREPVLIRATHG